MVDDHELVRIGLCKLLSRHDGFKVIAEAASAREAIEKANQYKPDVVVMDIHLPGRSGIEATREILKKRPKTRVVMLTSYSDEDLLFAAISAGVSGYVLKKIGSQELVDIIRKVGQGGAQLDPAVTDAVLQRVRWAERKAEDEIFSELTRRELQILSHLSEGKMNKEIAQEVSLSPKTVRNYVSTILSKLDCATRTEAAAYAVKHDLQKYLLSEEE